MDGQQLHGDNKGLAFNPMFAFWALPFIMSQAWLTAWSGISMNSSDPKADVEDGQIPVPKPFQEAKDKELFA